MADEQVLNSIRRYLRALKEQFGLGASAAILFGSFARGSADEWSDIDLVVLADRFDAGANRDDVRRLWLAAAAVDSRIEPVPCGERQWLEDDKSAVLEIARREGVVVPADAA